MISKKQYLRLSIVLAIPLLLLGWWLAEKEAILPRHHIIYCEEFTSHISCSSSSATKIQRDNWLFRNGAVQLWGALLAGGFNHPIITVGHSEVTASNGNTTTLLPKDGGIKMVLSLPIERSAFAYCEVSPFADDPNKWGYSCSGGELIPDSFHFQNEETNHKFQEARKLIGEQRAKNETMEVRALFATILLPLIAYFLLSASLLVLAKITRYVIYGRHNSAA